MTADISGNAVPHGAWASVSFPMRKTGSAAMAAMVCAVMAFALVCFAPQVLNDGDTLWHVAAGQWMLRNHEILRADPFSSSFAGQPWHAHEWLSEIAMALAYAVAGWSGVLILTGAASAAAFGLLGWRVRRCAPPLTTAVILALAAICLAPSLLARPHLLVSPLVVLWTIVLMDARAAKRAPSPWWLGLIVLWANLHGSVILGLGLIAPFALEAVIEAGAGWREAVVRWGLFGSGAFVAALCTPRGLEGLLYAARLAGMKSMDSIGEWRAPDFQTLPPLEIALMAALFALVSRGARIPPVRLALVLGLLHMALGHVRHEVVLALIAAPIVAEALSGIPSGERTAARPNVAAPAGVGLALACGVAALRIAQPAQFHDSSAAPIAAVAHTPSAVRALPVLNAYDAGGYLIFQGLHPFIDGRTDMYGDAFNDRYDAILAGDHKLLADALVRYRIGWTLLPPKSAAAAEMDAMPGWRRIYADGNAVVHVREGAAATNPA